MELGWGGLCPCAYTENKEETRVILLSRHLHAHPHRHLYPHRVVYASAYIPPLQLSVSVILPAQMLCGSIGQGRDRAPSLRICMVVAVILLSAPELVILLSSAYFTSSTCSTSSTSSPTSSTTSSSPSSSTSPTSCSTSRTSCSTSPASSTSSTTSSNCPTCPTSLTCSAVF